MSKHFTNVTLYTMYRYTYKIYSDICHIINYKVLIISVFYNNIIDKAYYEYILFSIYELLSVPKVVHINILYTTLLLYGTY